MRTTILFVTFMAMAKLCIAQNVHATVQAGEDNGTKKLMKRWNPFADTKWYSQSFTDGIRIQNSFNKGGPYSGVTTRHFNYSNLVYFVRITNETTMPRAVKIHFTADSIPIPGSPDTFVKLFLPPDTMTYSKQVAYNYGVTPMKSLDKPTRYQQTMKPGEECLFYVLAVFFTTKEHLRDQSRGGNRIEFFLKGEDLYFRMVPQVDSLLCGTIKPL